MASRLAIGSPADVRRARMEEITTSSEGMTAWEGSAWGNPERRTRERRAAGNGETVSESVVARRRDITEGVGRARGAKA